MAGTFTNILLHVVFSTKGRETYLRADIRPRLFAYIGGIVRGEGASLLAAGGVDDHVHLLIRWRADGSVSDLMRDVKANSSRWIHETFPDLRAFAWQEGYGAFSVSESRKEDVIRYIDGQEAHHRNRSFKEEFVEFLRANGIQYDERYIWT